MHIWYTTRTGGAHIVQGVGHVGVAVAAGEVDGGDHRDLARPRDELQ